MNRCYRFRSRRSRYTNSKRIIDALNKSANNPENHRYPSYAGMMSLEMRLHHGIKEGLM